MTTSHQYETVTFDPGHGAHVDVHTCSECGLRLETQVGCPPDDDEEGCPGSVASLSKPPGN